MSSKPRPVLAASRRPWRPLAGAALTTAAMAALLLAPPGSTQSAPEVSGGGNVTTDTPNKGTDENGKQIATPQDSPTADPCAFFYDARGASHPGYAGSYSVTDKAGVVHTYGPGPLAVTIGWTNAYEGPDGTYARPKPLLTNPDKVACDNATAGEKYPLTRASLSGSHEGKSVSCTYETGSAGRSRFWRDTREFRFELVGTCSLVDAGVIYGFTTRETRLAVPYATVPGAASGSPGVVQVTWLETYNAKTVCTSATCTPPPTTTAPTTPGSTAPPTTTPPTTTTATTTPTSPASTIPGAPPTTIGPTTQRAPDGSPPSRGTLSAAPVQAPGSPGTPSGGLPSGLAGPATGGGGFAQAPPTPVAGSAPTAASATATAAGGAPAGSSAFVPSAAAAPGTAGAAARVAAPLPLIAAVPGADAAAQYNMVRHERPAIPAPVLAVGGGLWLMFVCAAGVRILNPRPEHEHEPVPAPAVGFPVDIEEESP